MSNSLPTAIITGASRGIGRALALLLAKNNFQLSLVARNKGELKDLAAEITEIGHRPLYFDGDVSDEAFVSGAVEKTVHTFGHIDYVINNAGIGAFGPTESYSATQWDQVFDTNVKGTFLFCQKPCRILKPLKKATSSRLPLMWRNASLMEDHFIAPLNMRSTRSLKRLEKKFEEMASK